MMGISGGGEFYRFWGYVEWPKMPIVDFDLADHLLELAGRAPAKLADRRASPGPNDGIRCKCGSMIMLAASMKTGI